MRPSGLTAIAREPMNGPGPSRARAGAHPLPRFERLALLPPTRQPRAPASCTMLPGGRRFPSFDLAPGFAFGAPSATLGDAAAKATAATVASAATR